MQTATPDVRRLANLLTTLVGLVLAGMTLLLANALIDPQPLPVGYSRQILNIETGARAPDPDGIAPDLPIAVRRVPPGLYWACMLLSVSGELVLMAAIAMLLPVAGCWRRGRLFDAVVTRRLTRFSGMLVIAALLGGLSKTAIQLLLALAGHGPRQFMIELPPLGFWSPLIVAVAILVIIRALRKAADLEEDARLTI